MRYAGMLLTLVIIGVLAVWMLRSISGQGPGKSVDWFYAHPQERKDQLAWCDEHPQAQDSTDCTRALAAQMRFESEPR